MRLLTLLGLFLFASTSLAEDPATSLTEAESAAITKECVAAISASTKLLADDPKNVPAFSARGDAHLFLGHFDKAREDFEKMIALDPAQDAPHWRLGIVYYFLGEYAKGAAQFEKYHAYDDRDRENGVWHFICLAKVEGVGKAREKMLVYDKFDRHPFPSLYEMFAGKMTSDQVLAEVEKADVPTDEKDRRRFFASLYAGFDRWLAGDKPNAIKFAELAVANRWGKDVSEKTYMWQVARIATQEWKK